MLKRFKDFLNEANVNKPKIGDVFSQGGRYNIQIIKKTKGNGLLVKDIYNKEFETFVSDLDDAITPSEPNKVFYKTWSKIVINPNEDNSQYDNQKPEDWDGDAFVSWIGDNMTGANIIEDNDIKSLLNLKNDINPIVYYGGGSGLNSDKEFNKYNTWRSALYDVWDYLQKN